MATMQLDVTFRNIDSSEALKNYANQKVSRVNKYIDRPLEAHVVLSNERHEMRSDIQINVHQSNLVLRGKAVNNDMYAAIDLAMDKIERQLRRYKDKLKSHKPSPDGQPMKVRYGVLAPTGLVPDQELGFEATEPKPGAEIPPLGPPPGPPFQPKIIRSNEFIAKRLTIDEAVMHMDLMNNEFLVFRNIENGLVNIIYRRKDSNIGLIEATAD